jgi:serine/threonine-protein kinase
VIPSRDHKPELDKYEIFEEIGHGGMATVFRGRDRRLDREVAVKVIHRHLRENREVAARFVSEARAVAKVKHPNIVEVYDVSDEADDERYLVVELVRGITLRKLLQQQGHVPAEVAAAIGLQIGAGLAHAHEHAVVHRDVKPENVLVEGTASASQRTHERNSQYDVRVKITDFGIAKLLDAQGVTATGQVLGSPAHMAPEQIEGAEVDARADVFGLGVLLYECMVGKLPFDGKNPAQVLRRVLDGSYVPADRARPSVGSEWSRILARALARDAKDRYPTISELCSELRAELSRLGFDEPQRYLNEYLAEPSLYLAEYEPRIVGVLVALGRKARAARNLPLAAAQFNRALAFRPNGPELLAEVAGLARRERLLRLISRGAIGGAGLLVTAGFAFAVSRSVPRHDAAAREGTGGRASVRSPSDREPTSRIPPAPSSSVPQVRSSGSVPPRVKAPSRQTSAPPAPAPPAKRRVKVNIRGARAGSVMIDGVRHDDWFTTTYELTTGSHNFEFIPPNEDCCVAPEPQRIVIEPNPSGVDKEQLVEGHIRFKDAVLQVNVPADSEVTCPGLLLSRLKSGAFRIQMSGPEVRDKCTVFPPPGEAPKDVDVTLRAGGTFSLAWP